MKALRNLLHASLFSVILAMPLPVKSSYIGLSDSMLVCFSQRAAQLLEGFGETESALKVLENYADKKESHDSSKPSLLEFRARLMVRMGMYERADSILRSIEMEEDAREVDLRKFARAEINLLAGKYEAALSIVKSFDENSLPLLDDYRDYIEMAALVGLKRFKEAQAVGMALLKSGYSAALTPRLESILLETLIEDGKDSLALVLINDLKPKLDDKERLMEFLSQEMRIYFKRSEIERARELAMEIAGEYAGVPGAIEILRGAESKITFNNFKSSDLLALLDYHIANAEVEPSRKIMNALKQRKLKSNEKEKLRLQEAGICYLQGNYQGVITLLQKGFRVSALTRDSLLLKARAFRKIGNLLKAAVTYRHLATSYPYLGISPEALHVAAGLFEKANYKTKSREIEKLLMKRYPNNYYGGLAALKLAGFYMKRNYRTSLSILQSAAKLSSKWHEENLYYQAKLYAKLGDRDKSKRALENLRKINRSSFYLDPSIKNNWSLPILASSGQVELYGSNGLLNFILSAHEKRLKAYAELEQCIESSGSGLRYLNSDGSFLRAKEFLRFGLCEWAEGELEITNRHFRNNPAALLELGKVYNSNAMAWRSVKTFEALNSLCSKRASTNTKHMSDVLTYPIVFPGLICRYCAANNLPPNLIFSLIREESRFHSRAVSRAGALGLMQLMPETGEMIADELGYPMDDSSLFRPHINLALGIEYASRLLDKCGGDYHMMLAAYNAGLSNARRWFNASSSGYSMQETVDDIDFKETRNYIRRVIESSHVYSSLYETESVQ